MSLPILALCSTTPSASLFRSTEPVWARNAFRRFSDSSSLALSSGSLACRTPRVWAVASPRCAALNFEYWLMISLSTAAPWIWLGER